MESYVERPPLPGLAGVVRTVRIQRTGAPYPRGQERVVVVIEPERQTVGVS